MDRRGAGDRRDTVMKVEWCCACGAAGEFDMQPAPDADERSLFLAVYFGIYILDSHAVENTGKINLR